MLLNLAAVSRADYSDRGNRLPNPSAVSDGFDSGDQSATARVPRGDDRVAIADSGFFAIPIAHLIFPGANFPNVHQCLGLCHCAKKMCDRVGLVCVAKIVRTCLNEVLLV